MSRAGNSSSASCHSRCSTRFSPGNPATAKCRASTRFTLPSSIASRSPKANTASAEAIITVGMIARPSSPSVRFTAWLVPTITKKVSMMKPHTPRG